MPGHLMNDARLLPDRDTGDIDFATGRRLGHRGRIRPRLDAPLMPNLGRVGGPGADDDDSGADSEADSVMELLRERTSRRGPHVWAQVATGNETDGSITPTFGISSRHSDGGFHDDGIPPLPSTSVEE